MHQICIVRVHRRLLLLLFTRRFTFARLFRKAHHRALESNADAILPDMTWYHSTGDSPAKIGPPGGDYSTLLSGRQAFILSLDWTIHGFSLRRMELVKKLGYDE